MSGLKRILVSACLLGRPVRYNGTAKTLFDTQLERWKIEDRLVSFCPEVAAGLPTPRPPAEIGPTHTAADVLMGRGVVRDAHGADVTRAFMTAAALAVSQARNGGCRWALLTDGSPSCGTSFIHSGHFDGTTRAGSGVVAGALLAAGVEVFAPADMDRLVDAVESAD